MLFPQIFIRFSYALKYHLKNHNFTPNDAKPMAQGHVALDLFLYLIRMLNKVFP